MPSEKLGTGRGVDVCIIPGRGIPTCQSTMKCTSSVTAIGTEANIQRYYVGVRLNYPSEREHCFNARRSGFRHMLHLSRSIR